jgi:hypothetical protein
MKDARQKAQELYNNLRTVPPNNIRAGKISEWNKIAEQDISAIEQALKEAAKADDACLVHPCPYCEPDNNKLPTLEEARKEMSSRPLFGESYREGFMQGCSWFKSRLKNVGE